VSVDSSRLSILFYPHPALRVKAEPVPAVNAEVREVAARMIELMRAAPGIGLAAPQVGLGWRMFVAHVPPAEDAPGDGEHPESTEGPVVYINPVLSDPQGGMGFFEEGCLSLPDIRGQVLRPPTVTITATDIEGNRFTQTGTGLLATCWQHECDHLDGVLIIDRMRQIDRIKSRSAIRRLERAGS